MPNPLHPAVMAGRLAGSLTLWLAGLTPVLAGWALIAVLAGWLAPICPVRLTGWLWVYRFYLSLSLIPLLTPGG